MPSNKPLKSLAEQLGEIEEPIHWDSDPEVLDDDHGRDAYSETESIDSNEEALKREHYQEVGKSNLRKNVLPILGKQYSGERVARDALGDESSLEDSDDEVNQDGMSVDDEDASSPSDGFAEFDGPSVESGGEGSEGSEGTSSNEEQESQSSSQSDAESESDAHSTGKPAARALSDADRAAMREMLVSEQKAVAASISQAAQADVAKGEAVQAQRSTYNSHLNTRIRMQQALEQANSLCMASGEGSADSSDDSHAALAAAEAAAVTLLNTISTLQASLQPTVKRSFSSAFTTDTSDSEIHSALASSYAAALPRHRAIISKWSAKTQASSGRPQHDKFGASTVQPLLSVLDSQLHGAQFEKHVARTQVPRKCAPLQAAAGVSSDVGVYDDADFYAGILQSFVEARSGDTAGSGAGRLELNVDITALRRANKVQKKNVDTKASKGRRLRYTVHDKLQNFMAPRDIGSWGDRQADELFASLLGRRVKGGLGEREEEDDDDGDRIEVDREMEGLRLFRNGA